jgi:GLPGLI family protein
MKLILTLFIFLVGFLGFSQANFRGIATYESKSDTKITISGMDEAQQEIFRKKMAKFNEITFELQFSPTESIYKEVQKLELNNKNSLGSSRNFDIKYKNLKDKVMLTETEMFEKAFLISEKLPEYNWKFIPETKTIGNYSCQKAIAIIPVSEEEKADYEKQLKEQEKNPTSFFVSYVPQEAIITVWFTADIPIANGPKDYWGLPGLILEINDGNTVILCSKIVLNPKEKFKIKKPNKGKEITRKVFDKIQSEKFESMKDGNGVIKIQAFQN